MFMRRLACGFLVAALMCGMALAADSKKDKDKKKDVPPPPDPALTECVVPFRPAVVLDGASATAEEINALAARIRRYQGLLNDYRACLSPTIEAAKSSGDQARYSDVIKQYNESVAAEEEVVAKYQKILAAHKAAERSSHPTG